MDMEGEDVPPVVLIPRVGVLEFDDGVAVGGGGGGGGNSIFIVNGVRHSIHLSRRLAHSTQT
jgi:hypothetical protein